MPDKPWGANECQSVPQFARIDVVGAQRNHEQHDRHFDNHDRSVEPGALLDADHQDGGDHQRDDERRKIEADLDAERCWARPAGHAPAAASSGECAAMIVVTLSMNACVPGTRGSGRLRHLPRNDVFGGAQRRSSGRRPATAAS